MQENIFRLPDPRIALAGAFIYSIAVATLSGIFASLLSCLPPLALLVAGRAQWGNLFRRFRSALLFMLIFALMLPFTTPGPAIAQWSFMSISIPGVKMACLICLKCFALLAIFACLVAPLSTSALAGALYWFHCPSQLVAMFLLMDLNLHIIKEEWRNLKTAAMLRGFHAQSNMHSYRTLAAMLALLLTRAVARARRMHEGMLLRGFDGRFPVIKTGALQKSDLVFLAIAIMFSVALLFINSQDPDFAQ